MIKISAIICTFKRADYLRHAVRSLCEQTLDPAEYEIIVVDNAVEAETEILVSEFQNEDVNLRYVTEKEVGLNRARNTGLQVAAGRYVAYIDDDARADANWLKALVRAFERTTPAPAAVGGRVWLNWHGEKPSWVPEHLLALFTYVDHGEEAHPLRDHEYLVGANLAFDKDSLRRLGGFDPNLDRQGAVLLSGGDTAVVAQLQRNKKSVYYEPAAIVWHSVLESRKRPTWLVRRLFWDGASQPLLDTPESERSRRSTTQNAYWDLRRCCSWSWKIIVAVLKGRKDSAWESFLALSQRVGRLRTQVRLIASIDN